MATSYMTPGVYIVEKNAFPGSAVAVATAVPVFVGYTQKAERNGKSLLHVPTRITSFAEYVENFGGGFKPRFKIAEADPTKKQETFTINTKKYTVDINAGHKALFYNCMRLFYANGGSNCYVMSIGTYGDKPDGFTIALEDYMGNDTKPNVFEILKKEFEPTLVVLPDAIAMDSVEDCYSLYGNVLTHAANTQSRFGIFDVAYQSPSEKMDDVIKLFRDKIGINELNYGAAYYPWLKTSIVQASEIDFQNLDVSVDLSALLPEDKAKAVVAAWVALTDDKKDDAAKTNYHQSLKASSPTYVAVLEEIRARLNELPPSAAMAGLYTFIDNSRGVWKAPANASLSMVNSPLVNVSSEEQQNLNVDVLGGKSINVIRTFPGIGTLVWGARTLDGNSQDWRYVNVRRTLIMIEQSLKLATRSYVFEPNNVSTWVTVSSMINNFLYNLWNQGALAGAVPAQAYNVQIGLGSTMTPTDILDGIMRINVGVAIVRPAEFIIITFQQKQQES
ncbi:phage tail sheath C-terminal domain-containing protein [Danxiaibacter flavus]|uniref:Phage tail sheath C-terminal domain-containing protein n=1 Tax=Danxiaibacter flavus TaxID=3049108 RepID=A0ABV3ZEE0_9BACT|nr:phage tail sheath C-terminal domain-containing protein [Chitinophagaceae bacterium DXS]